ncbi:hypothetical protein D1007_47666 [Hordeum vulgare]|nr:hypothetical protein D1007_47666 [Hordeum vulgare]
MNLLHVQDEGLHHLAGLRPHANPTALAKEKLLPYYIVKETPSGEVSYVMNPFLDVMHRIFRNTLFPRVGNKDQVHSYLVDMLIMCQKGGGTFPSGPLDVSHVMWNELYSAVFNRKVPIYGLYLFYFIKMTWAKAFPAVEFLDPNWIQHEPIKLRQKDKWANTSTTPDAPRDSDEDMAAREDEVVPESRMPSSAEPSWAKKLTGRMKTLFCMQTNGQYRTHVAQKESRQRDKMII